MSTFAPLQYRSVKTSPSVTQRASMLRPNRGAEPPKVSEAAKSAALSEQQHTPSFSFAHIPIDDPVQAPRNTLEQRRGNTTGLPDRLKDRIESLSGMSLDDVKVHYNSSNPAQLQALAYTQGTEIHVAPKQERYLAHEAWHVVQQKQGRVQSTMHLQGRAINNNAELEHEADVMPTRLVQGGKQQSTVRQSAYSPRNSTIQRVSSLQVGQRVKVHTGRRQEPIISGTIKSVSPSWYTVMLDGEPQRVESFLQHVVYKYETADQVIEEEAKKQVTKAMEEEELPILAMGAGPAPGVLEISDLKQSSNAFRRYAPSGKHALRGHRHLRAPARIKNIEYVFDPLAKRFAVGRNKSGLPGGLSPHQHLAQLINADEELVVGGHFARGENGEILLDENSGHYGRRWTPEVREQIVTFLRERTGQKVIHESWNEPK